MNPLCFCRVEASLISVNPYLSLLCCNLYKGSECLYTLSKVVGEELEHFARTSQNR